MRTANPALNEKTFEAFARDAAALERADRMTLEGTATKTGYLLAVLAFCFSITWRKVMAGVVPESGLGAGLQTAMPWVLGGLLGGAVLFLVMMVARSTIPWLATPYAACEGLLLGGISAAAEAAYPRIAMQAVALTIGTALALLMAYRARLIRASENFKLGVFAATGGIALVYLATLVLGLFGLRLPFLHDSGPVGIAFSLFVCVIAALNLVLDFDFIERGVERGAPKRAEWTGAWGLLVTLIWLYIEVLRLLMKLRER